MRYSLLKNKNTGERSVRINKTGEIIKESENPELYSQLRERAIRNNRARSRNDVMESLGLIKVKGAVSGKTYWE